MTRQIIGAAILGLLGVVVATATTAAPARGVTLGVNGRANATPSIAALGDEVAVVWGATTVSSDAGATDVFLALSRDGGRTFGPPHRVNNVAGDASLGGEQPPRVALAPRVGREPSIVVVWTAKRPGGTRILIARSENGGSSFSSATSLAGGEAAGNRGWEAIATDRDGQLAGVWLDHRELAPSGAQTAVMHNHAGHDHAPSAAAKSDGVARAQLSKLYFSRIGVTGNDDQSHAIAAGVCYCCKTAVVAGPDGSIYAAWRHVYPGNVRDIAFTVSRDGGRTFVPPLRVSDDDWVLDGCPENGPGMAVDSRNRVHIVWPTLVNQSTPGAEPALELFYTLSYDGRSFAHRRRVPTDGVPRHAGIVAASDDSLLLVWEEQTTTTRRVVMGRARGNEARFTREVLSDGDGGPAVYPVVAAAGNASVVAWTRAGADRSVIRVRRLE